MKVKETTVRADDPRGFLRALFDAAVEAAQPALCVPPNLPQPPTGRTVVVGAGKAAAAMARAVEDGWVGDLSGLVVTRYGHGVATRRIEVVEAAHPVPDAAGRDAARRILDMVSGLGADDLALCLVSGGGSALLALPAAGHIARGQAGGGPGIARRRRDDFRDELPAQASLGDQGRAPRRGRRPRRASWRC